MAELAAAGLNRVNISLDSLDSLDRQRYASLARRDRLEDVLAGLAAADAAGLRPVKVNAVVMRGVCARRYATAPATRSSPSCGWARTTASGPGTASDGPTSSSPTAP